MKSNPILEKQPAPAKKVPNNAFPVVAIGASAGGLEAVSEFLKYLSPETGMAFIYVQHLSPDHKSMLTSLLAKVTSMKVQEVENKVLIVPNNIYIIPPDKEIIVTNGHISLSPRPDSPKINLPIDILFTSLAQTHKANTIGIILSGSANDGTLGMKSIKQKGGLTFAQDESAKFNSMPKSAITAGVVDYILSPKDIALELSRLSDHTSLNINQMKDINEDLIDNNDPGLKSILRHLQLGTGVDFGAYKMKTIKRRILRRMRLYKIGSLAEYSGFLKGNLEELTILYQDLLINVTSFFRDTETHNYLKKILFPKLLKAKNPGEALRIWVPACSTGEEAFSIAMMLLEIQNSLASEIQIQIFATDLSADAIQKARIGSYTPEELESVSPKRIHRFFTKIDGGYRIAKAVREICVFAEHNVLQDPPFSRLDFISCRNLLIYLDMPAQKRVATTFHYALKEGGYLMLGKSESVNTALNLFSPGNKKYKIFQRKNTSGVRMIPTAPLRTTIPEMQTEKRPDERLSPIGASKTKIPSGNRSLENAIDAVLVADFMPASVVINYQSEIIQFRGSTDLYLTHAPGKASFNILKMARPELNFALRNAISQAINSKQRVQKSGIALNLHGVSHMVRVEIAPLQIEWDEPLLLVLFSEQDQVEVFSSAKEVGDNRSPEKDRRIRQLEEQLTAAHADALAFSQEQEAIIEELQSAHEEVVSSNEELQTVNEELETSKEEIESTNEELTTTNQELQTRNDLLNESYDYSKAIISTLHEPLIVLDKDLRVKTANSAFYKTFNVQESETEGKLLYHLGNDQWNIPSLRELLEDIVPKNTQFHHFVVRHNFPGIGEKILVLNASRILQKRHGEQLILLSIKDTTEMILLQQRAQELANKDLEDNRTYTHKLEKAVRARTKALKKTNLTLAEQNTELEKMNKELEAFTYISSHDLQEPLRKIQTFAGRILEKENQNLSENGKNYLRILQDSAERMQALIQDLLSFSRVSSTERKFNTLELYKIVEEVKADFRESLEAKHANITIDGDCKVHIIPFLFRQVLHNLISNSLKFSKPDTAPQINISCHKILSNTIKAFKLSPNKEYTHISFSDNGIGFENEYHEKIFEVFQKLHSKDEYPGTGIGLAIVKKIVENHNGLITAKSEPQVGTTFDIYLPTN